jgi:cephalosporin hydroxylase
MLLTIDTSRRTLTVTGEEKTEEYGLYSPQAFALLSRQWMALGWNLGHWQAVSWMGRQVLQLPDDVLRLASAIWSLRPDVIVETGVYDGGLTLFFASLCRLLDHGRVIAVEIAPREGVREAFAAQGGGRITLIACDSATTPVASLIGPGERVFVFLDSDHSWEHVRAELEHYAPLVNMGSLMVVADTNMADLAGTPEGDVGWSSDNPLLAVDGFLTAHPEFERVPPNFVFAEVSYFSSGWLRRRRC